MGRDYVERGRGNKGKRPGAGKPRRKAGSKATPRQRKAPAKQAMPGWLWMLLGLTVGVVGAVIAYIVLAPSPGQDRPASEDRSQPGEQAPASTQSAAAQQAPQLPPKQPARFTFYEMLPNLTLVPRNDTYKPGESRSKNVAYVIQAGSFADKRDAETRRAELILLGMEPDIDKVRLPNGRTTYRVEIGPDDDYDRVKSNMATLIGADVDVFFREVPKAP